VAFVVSAGALAAVERAALPALPASVQMSDAQYQSYEMIWRTQPQVRTVVGFLARNIAQLGLHVYERRSDADRQRLANHPLAQLLDRPMPPEFKVTRYRLINAIVSDLALYDCAYLLKVRASNNVPRGLVRIPPTKMSPVGDNWFAPEGYELYGTARPRRFPADQVVHFYGYNPSDPRNGVSPMETLRRLLAEEHAAGVFREQMWRNGARQSGYLRRPMEAPKWSDPARGRFKADWQAQYAGDGPQAGGTPILEDGMEFVQASFTPEQAEYMEARKLTREEVAAAYYIPPPMVGILDRATFSNITEQHKMLYQDTLGPWLVMLEEDFELQLLPDVDPSPNLYVEFNISEKLKGSFEEQARSIQTLVGRPVLTADEGRALLNRNALGGDASGLVTPLNVLVGGQASPTDSAPNPTGAAAAGSVQVKARAPQTVVEMYTQTLRGFFRRQGAAVRSALGAKADEEWWDEERWNRELSGDLYALAIAASRQVASSVLESISLRPDAYDMDRTLAFLRALSARTAGSINGATKAALDTALASADPSAGVVDTFDRADKVRAAVAAVTTVAAISGFATEEAVKQVSRTAEKTWVVTSKNPRPSHAAMNGETVPVGETFSNGALWPGDSALNVDDLAGCTCELVVAIR